MRKKTRSKSICFAMAASMVLSSVAPATAMADVAVSGSDETEIVQSEQIQGSTEAETEKNVTSNVQTEAVTEEATQDAVSTSPTEAIVETEAGTNLAAAYEDGIIDNWAQDTSTVKGGEICGIEDGWLHLKSGSANGNNPSATAPPAIFTGDKTFDFSQAGFFETSVKTVQEGKYNRFGFYLGYANQNTGLFLGYNASGWYWQKYGESGDPYFSGTNPAPIPAANSTVKLRIDWTADKKATFSADGAVLFENVDFSSITGLSNKIAVKAGTYSTQLTDVYLKNIHYTGQAEVKTYQVKGKVFEAGSPANIPLADALVTIDEQMVDTGADGSYTFPEIADGTYTIKVAKDGYKIAEKTVTVTGADIAVDDIVLEKNAEIETETISSPAMDVLVSKKFPSVVQYKMKGDLEGKTFYGQESEIDTIEINGIKIKVTPESLKKAEFQQETDKETGKEIGIASYQMHLAGSNLASGEEVDAEITAVMTVKDNTLSFDITDVKNNLTEKDANNLEKYPIQTINIPNHSLVSVRTSQEGANLKGAKVSSKTSLSGDSFVDVKNGMTFNGDDYMYGFISNDELSAGLWSNAEYEGSIVYGYVTAGGARNTRVMATVSDQGTDKSVGLSSTPWYYDRKINSLAGNNTYVVPHSEMPSTKITITGDENKDGTIDWQDGAIAYRSIMHDPYKSNEVPDLVAHRIAMNFGSQAANPFLMTLDGVQRVYLNTDGLGQSVLLKGYGSEGHDSGHPDYANIGERIGGAEDMNYLMVQGANYGAKFGIHINASEMYPEAKAFNDTLARKDHYGWNWIDQGIGIDGLYDLGSGSRASRLDALKEKVGDNLDFIYLDVWGNNTSGYEDAWQSRKIADQMNDRGWRFTTEWGPTHEYDSTMQHWAADLGYGGYAAKGQNSEVMRFLRNHQKDSWVADYPSYNGAAQAPLLGGLNMTDFEGWSGRTNYGSYIKTTFTHNLATKFLQHYKVMKWEDGTPVTMSNDGGTFQWTPEMKITLQDDARANTVVVSRDSNDYAGNLKGYRSRTITYNGTVISVGAPTGGDGSNKGDMSYLIPWFWNTDGSTASDEKLYHWNTNGGTTTWDLIDGWKDLQNVVVYELTDQGKINETTVEVNHGQITLENMKAETPYVVYKGAKAQLSVNWKTSKYIYDTGFNSGNLDYWTKAGSGSAELVRNSSQNSMLKLDGEVSMTTKALTNLVKGQKYAVYVGVDSRSDAKTYLTINSGGKELASNYTQQSIVQNIISSDQHNTSNGATVKGSSYFQNMYVFFEAGDSEVTLTLKKEKGDGSVYLDDLRIVETKMDVVKETDKDGTITKFYQDFENNAQGLYPFAIAGPGGVTDNRIHLSEAHDPYTNPGWRTKKVADVLDGDWSVKVNGLCSSVDANGNTSVIKGMIVQTIPQNFRFEEGVTYNVKFKYQMGSEGTYALTVGDGEFNGGTSLMTIPAAIGETKEYSFTLIGSESGQSWFGLYATGAYADLKEYSSSANGPRDFSGYKDFILDDLTIEVSDVQKGDLQKAIDAAKSKYEKDYTAETWSGFAAALEAAETVMNDQNATAESVKKAADELQAKTTALQAITGILEGTVKDAEGNLVADAEVKLISDDLDTITLKTDSQGHYAAKDIFIRNYSIKITKEGYSTIYATAALTAGETIKADFAIEIKNVPDYYNYFDNGSIESIENLADNPSVVEISSTVYNGSDALEASFGSDRPSIVDTAAPKFKNGSFEADITPQSSPLRLGLVLRANSHNQRLYVGYGDAEGKWFWEFWNGSANNYSGMFDGPKLEIGKTSHIKAEIAGTKLSLTVDGTKVMSEVTVNGLFEEAGYAGINKRNGGSVIIDNIEIFNHDKTENTGNINGTIVDVNGTGLYNANLSLKDVNGTVIAATKTNLKGSYALKNIPYGDYTLVIEKTGYFSKTANVTLTSEGDAVQKDIVLESTDRSALEKAIKDAEGLKAADYTADSWKKLTDAVNAGKNLDKAATQAQVNAAEKAIRDAIAGLAKQPAAKPSKTALNAKIAQAKAIKIGNYTDASYKALTNAIAAAQKVTADANATQAAIDAQVRALDNAMKGLKTDSNKVNAAKVKAATVSPKAANYSARGIKLTWKKVSGADGYVVKIKQGSKWKTLKTIKGGSTVSYKYSKGTYGKSYTFAVRAYKKVGNTTVYSKYKTVSKKAVPQIPVIKRTISKGKVTLTWNKVSGVTGYSVMRKYGKKWSSIAKVKATTLKFVDKSVKKNKTYTYKVRAYKISKGKTIYGSYCKEIKVKAK